MKRPEILLMGLLSLGRGPTPMPADLIVYGTIWTGQANAADAHALAVRGDVIVAVGDRAHIAALAGPKTRIIEVGSGLVIPGFADGHTHFSDGGAQLAQVDLRDAATPAEFTRRIRVYASTIQPGTWILGGTWDHENWPGAPLPTREWIDSVTPGNPVFVQRLDGHMGVANSRALALAGIDRDTPQPAGGTSVHDHHGEPTGVLKDNAMDAVFAAIPPPTPEQADAAVVAAMRFANSHGIVAVSAVSSPWFEVAAVERARSRGIQTVRVSLYPPLADWRKVADRVRTQGPGDDWIRVAGVKGFVDGSLGSATALFFDHYLDEPASTGLFVTPEDSLRRWISAADSAGLQVVVHAIGDRANAVLLDIFETVARDHGPRDRRFRIEHAQHLRAQDIPRFGASGIIASMQPYHAADDGRWAASRIRPAQLAGTYAFRSLLDAHAHVQFGSDWTVAPLDPLVGIWAAVTRQTLDGKNPGGWLPEQKIGVVDALRAYTVENAYGVFAERYRGTLEPGMLADVVVLDHDIRSIPPDSIRNVSVRTTIVGGKVVFGD
jgi:predicted amidohydrolase YtcJ